MQKLHWPLTYCLMTSECADEGGGWQFGLSCKNKPAKFKSFKGWLKKNSVISMNSFKCIAGLFVFWWRVRCDGLISLCKYETTARRSHCFYLHFTKSDNQSFSGLKVLKITEVQLFILTSVSNRSLSPFFYFEKTKGTVDSLTSSFFHEQKTEQI